LAAVLTLTWYPVGLAAIGFSTLFSNRRVQPLELRAIFCPKAPKSMTMGPFGVGVPARASVGATPSGPSFRYEWPVAVPSAGD
jgi:hypothetical protein